MELSQPKNRNIKHPPKGTAGKFAALHAPDTKFKAEGIYSVRLICEPDEAAEVIADLEAVSDEMLAYTRADLEDKFSKEKDGAKKGKIKQQLAALKKADLPVKPVYDDDGNETGLIELNFKMNAQRKDRKTGEIIKMSPQFFNAGGNQMKSVAVWGGSILRVAGQVVPFYTAAVGAGASLRLSAVQVIDLVSGGAPRSASGFGFGREEGYSGREDDDDAGDSSAPFDQGDDAPADNDDF